VINGVVIAYLGVSPILATLGTMTMVKGISIGLTRGAGVDVVSTATRSRALAGAGVTRGRSLTEAGATRLGWTVGPTRIERSN